MNGFSPLPRLSTDNIRFNSREAYGSSFIPGLHDTRMIFERSQSQQKGI